MSRLRGVDDFSSVWARRTEVDLDGQALPLLSLPDLVQAKKTQRAKDWPMIQRLVDTDYLAHRDQPSVDQPRFWLGELRSIELLREAGERFPDAVEPASARRPWLADLQTLDDRAAESLLSEEQEREREADRAYWRPLKQMLEQLRHAERGGSAPDAGAASAD